MTYLRVILSLVTAITVSSVACKPRSDSSLAAKGSNSGSTTQVPRSIVATLGTEDSACKVKATDFANWAKFWSSPNAVTEQVESPAPAHLTAANAVAVKMHATAGAHIEWLKTAKEVSASGDRTAGKTSVDTGELDATIQVYESVQSSLKPILDSKLWFRWDAAFGEKVRKAFAQAADQYGATLSYVTRWKPTDDDRALDALEAAQAQGASINVKPPEAVGGSGSDSPRRSVAPEPVGNAGAQPVVNRGPPPAPLGATEPATQPAERQLPKKSAQQLAQEAQRQKAEEERQRAAEERRKAEEEKVQWLTFVTDAERALTDGNGSGTYPTISEVEAAIRETEAQKSYACNDGKPGNRCRGKPLIELLSKLNAVAGLFSDFAGTGEGYTVQEHTERVLDVFFEQRDKYGYPESDKRYKILMPVVVALHDIGKPVAVRKNGSTDAQHTHNERIVGGVLRSIGFTEAEVQVGKTIVSGDILGNHVKNYRHYSYTYPLVVSAAAKAGISKLEFMRLLRIEYLADANAYPTVRDSAFYVEASTGRLTSRNGALESLYTAVKSAEEREIADKLAAEKAARDRVAAEKAAAEKAQRDRIAAETAARERAEADRQAAARPSVEQELKEDRGTDLGTIGEQSALAEVKTGGAAKPASGGSTSTEPPFVGRRYVGSYEKFSYGFEFLSGGVCRFYYDRRTRPDSFATTKWTASGNQITVTYVGANNESGKISIEYMNQGEVNLDYGGVYYQLTSFQ